MNNFYTTPYKFVPSIDGTPFEGAKSIKIESWNKIEENLDNIIRYCNNEAKSPTFIMILGTWGQGKTELYKKYLIPKLKNNHYLLFLSAENLLNTLNNEKYKEFLNSTNISAQKILASIFITLRDNYDEIKKLIPSIENFSTPIDLITSILEFLTEKLTNNKRIYIFIDEVEELQSETENMVLILKGFKDIKNEGIKSLCENGEYSGRVHFFLSCTPEAYNKLGDLQRIADTSGSIKRRYYEIHLPYIHKIESCKYFWALLEYCWGGSLPTPLPIISSGILTALSYSSLGNLGAMVSNFARLITKNKINSNFKILDFESYIQNLGDSNITIGNINEKAFKLDQYRLIYNKISENSKNKKTVDLFSLMIAEPNPLSIEDIIYRLKVDENEALDLLNEIENILEDFLQISNPIIKFQKVSNNISQTDLINKIKMIFFGNIKITDEILKMDNYEEKLEFLINRIAFPKIENNKLIFNFYLPYEIDDLLIFYNGISNLNAKKLKNIFKKDLLDASETIYFLLSDDIIHLIYPVPLPPDLNFLSDNYKMFQIYQQVKQKQKEMLNKYFLEGLLAIINDYISDFKIIRRKDTLGNYNHFIANLSYINEKGVSLDAKILISFINGNFDTLKLNEILDIIRDKYIYLVIPIYTGFITKETRENITNLELDLDNEFVISESHKITLDLACKIVSTYLAIMNYPNLILKNQIESSIKKFIFDELKINLNFILKWVEKKIKIGYCISDLKGSLSAKKYPKFLKLFYIKFNDYLSISDIITQFEHLEKIRGFGSYNVKSIRLLQIPDEIKENRLNTIAYFLVENKFLTKIGELHDEKYKLKENLIEKRIIEILRQKNGKSNLKELKECFIIYANNPALLEDVYLTILEDKGLIIFDKQKNIILVDYNNKYKKLKEKIEDIRNKIQNNDGYEWFIETKKRDIVKINLYDYLNEIIINISKLKEYANINEWYHYYKLNYWYQRLEFFEKKFLESYRMARISAEEKYSTIENIFNEITPYLKNLQKILDYLHIQYNAEDIYEYTKIKNDFDEIETFYKKSLSKNEIEKYLKEIRNRTDIYNAFFYHKNFKDYEKPTPPYHNLKFWVLENKIKNFQNDIKNFIDECKNLGAELSKIENKFENNKAYYMGFDKNNMGEKGKLLYDKLKIFIEYKPQFSNNKKGYSNPYLREIINKFNYENANIIKNLELIHSTITCFKEFISKENEYLDNLKNIDELINKIILLNICDNDFFKKLLDEFNSMLKSDNENYNKIYFKEFNYSEINQVIETIRNTIRQIEKFIENLKKISEIEYEYNKHKNNIFNEIENTVKWVKSINWKNQDNYQYWYNQYTRIKEFFESHSWDNFTSVSNFNKKMDEFKKITENLIKNELT
ncbi:MAG: hypothetical protein ACTSRP_18810, partial [Candidatus Helarchaeota archaeon]